MDLPALHDGVIISRYKRFLADVELIDGKTVTAHCANTGAMTGCWKPGAPVQLSASDNPKRKLPWSLERVDMGAGWIGVNTSRVNQFIRYFIEADQIESLTGYCEIKSEPVYEAAGYAKSRLDLLLSGQGQPNCFVEIKNVTMVEDDKILFPDAVTTRGLKHLQLLEHAVKAGHRGVMLYAVNRPEGQSFGIASHIDPDYHKALVTAEKNGVEVIAFRIEHTATGVEAGGLLPVILD